MANPDSDPISSKPYMESQYGRAWRIEHSKLLQKRSFPPENDAIICRWLVEAPWAHGFWHSYEITCVHLRPLPQNAPTKFYLGGATHEIWVHAFDPAIQRQKIIDGEELGGWLTPKNFAAQFIEPTDLKAVERIEQTVRGIVNGNINPDTDAMSQWIGLYGDNMVKPQYRE